MTAPREYVGIVDHRTESDGLRAVRRVRLRQRRVLAGPVLLLVAGVVLALVGESALPALVGAGLAIVAIPSLLAADRAAYSQVTAPVVVRHVFHPTHLERGWDERRQSQLLPWASVDRVHPGPTGVVLEVSRLLLALPAALFPATEVGPATEAVASGAGLPDDLLADVAWQGEHVVPPGPRTVGGVLLEGLLHPRALGWLGAVGAVFGGLAWLLGDWQVLPVVAGSLLLFVGMVIWRLACVAAVPAPPGARWRQGLRGDLLVIQSPWQVDLFPLEEVREWLRHEDHLTLRGEGLELTVPAALFPLDAP